jgi:hypothetical protein
MRASPSPGALPSPFPRAVPPTLHAVCTRRCPPAARRAASFSFSTPTGDTSAGFECRLSADASGPNAASPALHDWRACTSPQAYSGLEEGRYIFQVGVRASWRGLHGPWQPPAACAASCASGRARARAVAGRAGRGPPRTARESLCMRRVGPHSLCICLPACLPAHNQLQLA